MKTPIMDESGVIQFPAPTLDVDQFASDIDSAYRAAQAAWQSRDAAEIDATAVALDLARRRPAYRIRHMAEKQGRWRSDAGQIYGGTRWILTGPFASRIPVPNAPAPARSKYSAPLTPSRLGSANRVGGTDTAFIVGSFTKARHKRRRIIRSPS